MRVGVLGGGLQGCCAALALADRGAHVTLFDRNMALISRAGLANEGKIYLGYMYAGDPSLRTAKTMIAGALSFEPFLKRYLSSDAPAFKTSMPASYVIHRDAQRSPEEIAGYFAQVYTAIADRISGRRSRYFDMDLRAHPRRWSAVEREAAFNPEIAVDVYETAEVAINPVAVAEALRQAISLHPRIETRLGCQVTGAVEELCGVTIRGSDADGVVAERFDQVANALWDGRLALNETMGMPAGRAWIHRLKYGVSLRLPEGAEMPPSATFVLGAFGEVVSYGDGLTYLTWYPACLRAMSRDITPPEWTNFPGEPVRSEVLKDTFRALSEIVFALRGLEPESLPEAVVKGGVIVAWGATDIYDPRSELHKRYEIGLTSKGKFHSIDPGKLTMAPYFADQCAHRLLG